MAEPIGFLITEAEIRSLFTLDASGYPRFDFPITGLPISILNKMSDLAQEVTLPSHNFNREHYKNVFLTSDIHSDLEKFSYILYNATIIDRYYTTHPDNASMSGYTNNIDGIISFLTNFEVIFTDVEGYSNFLLVIIGDLVDGKRDASPYEVRDYFGNLEVLLHVFLYNLRIKAALKNSEVVFTIGNHDWHTVITNVYDPTTKLLYNRYVHTTAKKLFGGLPDPALPKPPLPPGIPSYDYLGWVNRRNTLLPFYSLSPFLVVTIDNEVICVHGGLHNGTENMRANIIAVQKQINSKGLIPSILSVANKLFLSDESKPLWTRFYSQATEAQVCGAIMSDDNHHLTVVGHCPTDICLDPPTGYMANLESEDRDRCQHIGGVTQSNGCVLFGCKDADFAPRLAFVDITMSTAFRGGVSDSDRHNEILYLSHNTGAEYAGPRYYNMMFRIVNTMLYDTIWVQNQIVAPPTGPPAPGNLNQNPYNQATNFNRWSQWELAQLGGKRKKKARSHKKRQRSTRKVLRRK